jgi:hypothetical protein
MRGLVLDSIMAYWREKKMALTAEQKAVIVKDFGAAENDSGSPEVQVALQILKRSRHISKSIFMIIIHE